MSEMDRTASGPCGLAPIFVDTLVEESAIVSVQGTRIFGPGAVAGKPAAVWLDGAVGLIQERQSRGGEIVAVTALVLGMLRLTTACMVATRLFCRRHADTDVRAVAIRARVF